jgi:hypothetical protein
MEAARMAMAEDAAMAEVATIPAKGTVIEVAVVTIVTAATAAFTALNRLQ